MTANAFAVTFKNMHIVIHAVEPSRAQVGAVTTMQTAVGMEKNIPFGSLSFRICAPGTTHLAAFKKDDAADTRPVM
ncbi:hypothetical protein ASV34_08880 [Enterobacter hormaechei subsp. xiangfangensis]|nr:hypothetical protein ASV34_08880 [Enterobacter hormaechei subsp. xiangfangensis]KUQ38651.1 hypothetical protein AWI15_02870 [Enterobacter hormaechei subsp. xiangfangensis]